MNDATFWREFLEIQRKQLAELQAIRRALAEDSAVCPYCGEVERLENTSAGGVSRMTCLACGKSWNPSMAEVA